MICYQLRCADGHEFEGWFRDSMSFGDQSTRGLLSCPRCGSTAVDRGLMAPAVRTRRAPAPAATPGADAAMPPGGLPDGMRALLQRLRAEVERRCDDLGDRFAEEALRMGRGEIAPRGIYGNATDDDRDALAEEGIEIVQIPWLKPADG